MYDSMQATATRLLAKFGKLLTMSKIVVGTFNPATGTHTTTTTTHSVYAVSVGITKAWTDKFTITAGDRVLLVQADGEEPKPGYTIDGWTVIAVEPVKPADTAVLYRCHMRYQ